MKIGNKWSNDINSDCPPDQHFKRDSNGYWRFSFLTSDMIDLGYDKFADTGARGADDGPFMSIWYPDFDDVDSWKRKWKLKRINRCN